VSGTAVSGTADLLLRDSNNDDKFDGWIQFGVIANLGD